MDNKDEWRGNKIDAEVNTAYMTKDQERIIVLNKLGDLYYADSTGENRTNVANDVVGFYPKDTGIVYWCIEKEIVKKEPTVEQILQDYAEEAGYSYLVVSAVYNELYEDTVEDALSFYSIMLQKDWEGASTEKEAKRHFQYSYESQKSMDLGLGQYTYAANTLSSLSVEDGAIYLVKDGALEKEKLRTHDAESYVELIGVSSAGNICAWIEKKDNMVDVYICEEGIAEKAGSFETSTNIQSSLNLTRAYFSANEDMMVIIFANGTDIYRKELGEAPKIIKMNALIDALDASSYKNKLYLDDELEKDSPLYVSSYEEDSSSILFFINEDGSREKMKSQISDWTIRNGYLYYTDMDKTLYSALLNGAQLKEQSSIATDVETFDVSKDGKIVYYTKEPDNLYYAEYGQKSVRIDNDVSIARGDFKLGFDGRTIGYFKNVTEIKDAGYSASRQGDLMLFDITKNEGKKIDSDIVARFYTIGGSIYISPTSLNYIKYIGKDTDEEENNFAYGDLYHWDGKSSKQIAQNVVVN